MHGFSILSCMVLLVYRGSSVDAGGLIHIEGGTLYVDRTIEYCIKTRHRALYERRAFSCIP